MSDPKANLELGMTYVERLDFREQAHRHQVELQEKNDAAKVERAKYDLREARQTTYQTIAIGLFAAAVILGIVYAIYAGTRDPDPGAGPTKEERRETACVENGGGFVPEDLLHSEAGEGLCVFPGSRP